jgi:hypothetical protein
MELKTARLTVLLDPNKKRAFEQLCALQDRTPSQVVRQLIRDYLTQHGASYVASGQSGATAPADRVPARRPVAVSRARAARPGKT